MDTGVLSIILHQFPYPSHWTRVCSTIMFIFTIVLFLSFGTIYILRWTIYFKTTLRDVRKDPEEIALQACPAITWLTLTEQVQLTAAQSFGYGFTVLAFVMWWIALVWVLSILIVLYIHLVKYHSGTMVDKLLPTAVFVPVVGFLTVANAAGTIVNGAVHHTHLSVTLAIPLVSGFHSRVGLAAQNALRHVSARGHHHLFATLCWYLSNNVLDCHWLYVCRVRRRTWTGGILDLHASSHGQWVAVSP